LRFAAVTDARCFAGKRRHVRCTAGILVCPSNQHDFVNLIPLEAPMVRTARSVISRARMSVGAAHDSICARVTSITKSERRARSKVEAFA